MKIKNLILSTSIFLFLGCKEIKNESTKEQEMKTETRENYTVERPLETDLNNRMIEFGKKADADKKKTYAEGLKYLEDSKIVENALQVGETAIDFKLKNATGKEISLYEELKKGPVILMWYRGGWCPYCNLALHHMQEALPEFQKYGANLLALSPEVPDSSITTKQKNELQFEILSDVDNTVANKYKVVHKLTNDVAKIYEESFGLSEYNGNNKAELPLGVTYIIGQDKVIKYAFLDADYRKRAEPIDLIQFLKKLK
uniref:peroxiredoxin family protein n=1 Tax=Flavobacterium sp. TaxID=239 RepID=UPI00404ACD69